MVEITEFRGSDIKSCRLTKEVIKEIGKLIEDETKDFQDIVSPKFTLTSASRSFKSSKIEDFVKSKWPKDVTDISLGFAEGLFGTKMGNRSITKEVVIDFKLGKGSGPTQNRYIVRCNESIWANGVSQRIEEIIDENKTLNDFFHKSRSFPISYLLSLVLITLGYYSIRPGPSSLGNEVFGVGFVAFLLYAFVVEDLFKWLFPYIELEDQLNQTRFRKKILGVLLAIITSLIAATIVRFFFGRTI